LKTTKYRVGQKVEVWGFVGRIKQIDGRSARIYYGGNLYTWELLAQIDRIIEE